MLQKITPCRNSWFQFRAKNKRLRRYDPAINEANREREKEILAGPWAEITSKNAIS